MKDKRIWIVIGCILAIGTGVTHYTQAYVKSQAAVVAESGAPASDIPPDLPSADLSSEEQEGGAAAPAGTAAASAASPGRSRAVAPPPAGTVEGNAASAPAEEGGLTAGRPAALEGGGVKESDQIYSEGDAPGKDVPMSPLTGARSGGGKTGRTVDYKQRLMDLDAQIQRIRKQDTDSNVYSMKTSAETEFKMWESEVNTIYNALLAILTEDEAAGLAADQQEWLKNRDVNAAESSGRNSPSVEGVGYAATLASLTRERAYELAGWYEEAAGTATPTGEAAPAAKGP